MRSLSIFNVLLIYAVLQISWWGYLLIKYSPGKIDMVMSEFSVFIVLLLFGMYRLRKAIAHENALDQQQKNFLLSVTHELKSPLASVKLYLQTIIKRDLDREKVTCFLTNSLADIERLDVLVENMLMATKFENNTYTFPKEQFNFSELVQTILNRVRLNTQGRFFFDEKIEPAIQLLGDKFALSSAVSNIIENAVKYSAEGTHISLNLKKETDQVILQVTDEGIGIDDREKQKIFQKFYRSGNEETRGTKGTGLGLFIVKQVLDNHEASIEVSDNTPRGSVFEVSFLT